MFRHLAGVIVVEPFELCPIVTLGDFNAGALGLGQLVAPLGLQFSPQGFKFRRQIEPDGRVAVGDPAEIMPPVEHDAIWSIQEKLDFPKVIFGVERPPPGDTIMPDVMPRYAKLLQRHKHDKEV